MNNVIDTVNFLRNLGSTIHPDQSVFITTEENTFLGYIIDSVRMIFTLIIIAPHCCRITKVSHSKRACSYYRYLQQFLWVNFSTEELFYKAESLRRAYGDFAKQAFISTEAKIKLKWRKENMKTSFAPIKVQLVH